MLLGALVLLATLLPVPVHGHSVETGPGRWQVGEREIVISLWQQRLWAYEGAEVILV